MRLPTQAPPSSDHPLSLDYLAFFWSLVAVALVVLAMILWVGRMRIPDPEPGGIAEPEIWRREAPHTDGFPPPTRPHRARIDAVLLPTAALALLLPVTLVFTLRQKRWAFRVLQTLSFLFSFGLFLIGIWGLKAFLGAASRVAREHQLSAVPTAGLVGLAAMAPLAALLFAAIFALSARVLGRNLPTRSRPRRLA